MSGPGEPWPMRTTDAPLSANNFVANRPLSSVRSMTRSPARGPLVIRLPLRGAYEVRDLRTSCSTVKEGQASQTAQRVAALRLTFERVPTPFGDVDSDERLARDVAGSTIVDPTAGMARYLAARTAFFDRVAVGALERGIRQVIVVAGGDHGAPVREAKTDVLW